MERSAMRLFSAGMVLCVLLCLPRFVSASDSASEAKARLQTFVRQGEAETHGTDLQPELAPGLGTEAQAAYEGSMKAYYDYKTQAFAHRARVFTLQLISSCLIFFVVMALVVVGVYFSWLQFSSEQRRSSSTHLRTSLTEQPIPSQGATDLDEAAASKDNTSVQATTFKASMKGIEISSPILGVIILAMSLVFFFVYIRYVYPVHDAF